MNNFHAFSSVGVHECAEENLFGEVAVNGENVAFKSLPTVAARLYGWTSRGWWMEEWVDI